MMMSILTFSTTTPVSSAVASSRAIGRTIFRGVSTARATTPRWAGRPFGANYGYDDDYDDDDEFATRQSRAARTIDWTERRVPSNAWRLFSSSSSEIESSTTITTITNASTTSEDDCWRNDDRAERHRLLDEVHELPTVIVSSSRVSLLMSPKSSLRSFLPTGTFEGVHPRVRLVRPCENNDDQTQKTLLLRPGAFDDGRLAALLDEATAGDWVPGPVTQIVVPYHQMPVEAVLSRALPPEAHPPPSSYETVGNVVRLNLRERHDPHARLVGRVLLDRLSPTIRTVVRKVGEVGGHYRTMEAEVLATDLPTDENPFWVRPVERGLVFAFDLRDVYWCSRLAGERQRFLDDVVTERNATIADAFCGVGALCVAAAAHHGHRVLANDANPAAIEALRRAVEANGVADGRVDVSLGDARAFMRRLGDPRRGERLPDHIVMNHPSDAPAFLDALRWWPTRRRDIVNKNKRQGGDATSNSPKGNKRKGRGGPIVLSTIHLYTFSRRDDERGLDAAEAAVDAVANALLPEPEPRPRRRAHLDDVFGCNVRTEEVRDVAPGKIVVRVDFDVTRKLVRHMQGDFADGD